jgi:hypothetical protein
MRARFKHADANPSWWPRVLAALERDYPAINDRVWSTAISENADRLVRQRAAAAALEAAGQTGAELSRVGLPLEAVTPLTVTADPCPDACPHPLSVHSAALGCWLCDCLHGRPRTAEAAL